MPAPLHEGLPLRVAVRAFWRSLKQDLFDSYRPELHYMRGPGPRWKAKHRPGSRAPAMVDASI